MHNCIARTEARDKIIDTLMRITNTHTHTHYTDWRTTTAIPMDRRHALHKSNSFVIHNITLPNLRVRFFGFSAVELRPDRTIEDC